MPNKSTTIEGRLIMFEDAICIATKDGIYFANGVIAELANEIGLDRSHFVRLVFEEINEASSRSGLIKT